MQRKKIGKEVGLAIAVLAAVAAWASPVHAQLGASAVITVPGSITSDQAAETSLGDIDTVQFPPIVRSLTQGTADANYISNASTIASLDQALFPANGINAQNFSKTFQGWVGCEPDCTSVEQGITQSVLPMYQAALQVVQQQEQELVGEGDNAGTIDQAVHNTTHVLTALQGIADLLAMDIKEKQYERQALNALVTIQATHYAQDLNDGMQQLQTKIDTTPGQHQGLFQ